MFPTILVARYIAAIWQIHKVTPSIMSFMNSHCGSNFTAEYGSTIKEKEKKSWKYSTQTHTSHTRVLHGELSWEGKQFHLRELWRPTLGRLDWSRATEAGCILMTGCLCGSVLGKDGGCCIHVCMSGGKGQSVLLQGLGNRRRVQRWFWAGASEGTAGCREGCGTQQTAGRLIRDLIKNQVECRGSDTCWHAVLLLMWCLMARFTRTLVQLFQNSCSLDAATLSLLTIYDSEAKNCNITIRVITVTRAWLLCNNCYYIVICLLTFTCRHFTIHKSKRYWIRL